MESGYCKCPQIKIIRLNLSLHLYLQKNQSTNYTKVYILFNGEKLNKSFKVDFLCYDTIILEIKAARFLHNDNKKQTINYLHASGLPVGLLVNFGESSLKWKRFINTPT